jgi:hypothetical protein
LALARSNVDQLPDLISPAAVVRVGSEDCDGLAVSGGEFLVRPADRLRQPIEARRRADAEEVGHAAI